MKAATAHNDRCVCVECMREAFPLKPLPEPRPRTLAEMVAHERSRSARADSIVRLDTYQRQLLNRVARLWNADRAHRGLSPVALHDVLTQGLESLEAMLIEAAQGR